MLPVNSTSQKYVEISGNAMGRTPEPLYKDPKSGNWFARWYEGKKRFLLSLETPDKIEALRRLPIVRHLKISWTKYRTTFLQIQNRPKGQVKHIADHDFYPPLEWTGTKDGVTRFIEENVRLGKAFYDEKTGNWTVYGKTEEDTVLQDIQKLKITMQSKGNIEQIEEFYTVTMPQLYTDKKTADRFAKIWLTFLKELSIGTWDQITEPLLVEFKKWRQTTPQGKTGGKGVIPGARVINRHMRYLSKSFDEACHRKYMSVNPIRNWKPDSHHAPLEESLSVDELHAVLSDEKFQQDFLTNGRQKVPLGYKLLDYFTLLFTSCKRRKEILHLLIENINFEEHLAHYIETKNNSKGTQYSIHKAFWLTSEMELLLKRVIGNRTSGPVFEYPAVMRKKIAEDEFFNAEYLSAIFKEIASKLVPQKNVSLKNLRQTATDILEKAGLTDDEIDATLGHHQIKTALLFYKDRSSLAVGRRLSGRTRKGVEILSETIKGFLL